MTVCGFEFEGKRSVNHPDRWVVEPKSCPLPAGHEGQHVRVLPCGKPTLRKQHYDWPCVLAVGHEGDCRPDEASRFLPRPPREIEHETLVRCVHLLISQIVDDRRRRAAMFEHLERWQLHVEMIAAEVLDGTRSPHGNNHTDVCWRRHPHCFAFAIIGSGGMDRALETIKRERKE